MTEKNRLMPQKAYQDYLSALQRGNNQQALQVARAALGQGLDMRELYLEVFQSAMYEVGRLWETNQLTVAQEHLATATTQRVMAQVHSQIFGRPTPGRMVVSALGRTLVAACVSGEQHELGLRMVADFFEMEGWEVYYLGANVPTRDVVRMVNSQKADLLALSVTTISNLVRAGELIRAVRLSALGPYVKILIGGQPFNRTPDLYSAMGADFTAINAGDAVQVVGPEVMAGLRTN
jgi:MerR family transcriptional regulator, light-induced transcriptional regulator